MTSKLVLKLVAVVVLVSPFCRLKAASITWEKSFQNQNNHTQVVAWEKRIRWRDKNFPIGRLVSLKFSMPEKKFPIESFVSTVEEGMGVKFINSGTKAGVDWFEGDWGDLGETLKIGYRLENDQIQLIFVKHRQAYAEEFGQLPNMDITDSYSWMDFLITPAMAQESWGNTEFEGEQYIKVAQKEIMPKVLGVAFGVVGVAFIGEAAGRLIGFLVDHFRGEDGDKIELIKQLEKARKDYEMVMKRIRGVTEQVEKIMKLIMKYQKDGDASFPNLLEQVEIEMLDKEVRLKFQENKIVGYLKNGVDTTDRCYRRDLKVMGDLKEQQQDLEVVFNYLKQGKGICSIMRKGIGKILDAENDVHKIYTNIFSYSIEELSEAVEVAGEDRLVAEKQAVKNARETKRKCEKRVKALYKGLFAKESKHLGLNWEMADKQREYYRKFCFPVGKWRKDVPRRQRLRRCGKKGSYLFGRPTDDKLWARVVERVWRLDFERQEKVARLNGDIQKRKRRDLARCRSFELPDRSRVILNNIQSQLEFLDQMRADQITLEKDMRKLSLYDEKIRQCSF